YGKLLHGMPLEWDRVPIYYGLMLYDINHKELFAYSNKWVGGGCLGGGELDTDLSGIASDAVKRNQQISLVRQHKNRTLPSVAALFFTRYNPDSESASEESCV
ncbi:MAG: hypothetical protein WAV47_04335, partial [Blastocatellia bacterium]